MFTLRNLDRRLVVLGVLMSLSFISACSQEQEPILKNGVKSSSVDLDRLAARAQAEGKNVYMEFTAPNCIFCWGYNSGVLSSSESQQALKKVIFVQVNYDQNPSLAGRYAVSAVPTGLLLKPQNGQLNVADRHTGGLSQDRFVKFISR
jgi:thiol:disulfide interchange protein